LPYSCTISPQQRRGIVRLTGTIQGTTFMEAMEALYRSPEWQPGFDALWDARGVTELLLDERDVKAIVALMLDLTARMGPGRAAFVIARELDWMIARLLIYRTRVPSRERRTFETMEEALAWLDAPPVPPPSLTLPPEARRAASPGETA
jgi:hypothetical protein